MHFYTVLKKVELIAFVDTGATENFISQAFVEEHRLGTKPLWRAEHRMGGFEGWTRWYDHEDEDGALDRVRDLLAVSDG